ncbi:hypothetical protein KY321_00135 [Candidatus Woesearchaeota archaeon]|nr:hypothetical protein [Candidatus Woesearchaeota archaeon]
MDAITTLDDLTEKHDTYFKRWKRITPDKSYGEILMQKIDDFDYFYNLFTSNEDLLFLNNLMFVKDKNKTSQEIEKEQELFKQYTIGKIIDRMQVGGIASHLTTDLLVDYGAGVALPLLNAASYGLVKKLIAIEPDRHKQAGMNLIAETFDYFPNKPRIKSLPTEKKFRSYQNKKGKFLVALAPHTGMKKTPWYSSGFRESKESRPATPQEMMLFVHQNNFEGVIYFPSENRELESVDSALASSDTDPVTQYCDIFYDLSKQIFPKAKYIVTETNHKAGVIAHMSKDL